MPRDDLDPGCSVGEPTDAWIVALIRRVRGLPPDAPVADVTIRQVRAQMRALARRRILARRERGETVAATVADLPDPGRFSEREFLTELVSSPHGQVAIYTLLAMPLVLMEAGRLLALHLAPQHRGAPVRSYLAGKLGGEPWSKHWGNRRPYATVPGGARRLPVRTPYELGPHPLETAAVNAVTPARARDWLYRLDTGSESERDAVLRELQEIGLAACEQSAPLPLWLPEAGPPRGLWPDPPPPEDAPAPTAGTVPSLGPAPRQAAS